MVTIQLLFLAATVAAQLAQLVPQDLAKRTAVAGGGWSLAQETCPSDAPQCGSSWCCPTELTCMRTGGADIAEACCPGTTNCVAALQSVPFCADYTWSLWNSTTDTSDAYGYFCCLPGQIGLNSGDCVDAGTVSAATLSAVLIAPPAVTASSTASSQSSATVSTTSVTSTVTSPATTTKVTSTTTGGVGGLLSTALSVASAVASAHANAGNMVVDQAALSYGGALVGVIAAALL